MDNNLKYKTKLYLFRLKKIIEKQGFVDLFVNYTESDMKLIDEIDSAVYNLKEICNKKQNKTNELMNNNKTVYDYSLLKNELIEKYRLFIIILGIIDKKIKYNIEDEVIVNKLMDFREYIINKYLNYSTIINNNEIDEELDKIFPIKLYYKEGFKKNNIYIEKAHEYYIYGYNISDNISMDLIIKYYTDFIENISEFKENNKIYKNK